MAAHLVAAAFVMLEWLGRFSNVTVGSGITFSLASFLGGDLFAFHVSMGGLYCNVPLMAAGALLTLMVWSLEF